MVCFTSRGASDIFSHAPSFDLVSPATCGKPHTENGNLSAEDVYG